MTPLERAIKAAGSQAKLAEQLGIDHTNVSHWVRGTKPLPDKHKLAIVRLTRWTPYEVDPYEFIDG
jgi:DNA-binding transcriptional regulator YdaS (Cro superfamily)